MLKQKEQISWLSNVKILDCKDGFFIIMIKILLLLLLSTTQSYREIMLMKNNFLQPFPVLSSLKHRPAP